MQEIDDRRQVSAFPITLVRLRSISRLTLHVSRSYLPKLSDAEIMRSSS